MTARQRARGSPKRAVRGLRNRIRNRLPRRVGRHRRSQPRASGLGFAVLAQVSLMGQRTT